MTKEEILEAITDDKMMPFIQPDQLANIVDFVIKNFQPSLPSDLDEAAKKKARDIFESLEKHDIGEEKNRVLFGLLELEALALTFSHFGAEWMAGQGETVEGVFKAGDPGYPDVRMGEQYSIEHILLKPDGIEPGDEVIVQIRKKQ